jgi:molecular chaperone DnaK (HSP70)
MLFYPRNEKKNFKFGVEAKNASESPNITGILFRHFKLLLSREYDGTVDDDALKGLKDFEVIDAIKNYLQEFNKEARKRLKEESHIPSDAKVGYIVTIPTMWSDEAKHTMRVAVQKAGLVKKEHINDRVHFITEAEAAAIYCEKYYGDFNMEIGQKFMICDAGGGTVDLVTFQVTQDKTTGKKCISELTSGSGGNCGSVFLDEAFRKYILNKFEKHSIKIEHAGINRLVDHFIHEIKVNMFRVLVAIDVLI